MSSSRAIIRSFYAIGDTTSPNPVDGQPGAAVSGSMAASIVGPSTILDKVDQVCFQVSWTSSNAVGTVSVQGSVNGIDFDDLTFATPLAQPSSNNGRYLINLALIPFTYIRVKYTRASGTGAMEVYMSVKGV